MSTLIKEAKYELDHMAAAAARFRRVILESPYGAATKKEIDANILYARQCVRDCLARGEAPIASHLLFTQPGVLSDSDPAQRWLGISAGWAWITTADASVVYTDRGISPGMQHGINLAKYYGLPIEERKLK